MRITPAPTEDVDMNSSRWKWWVESARELGQYATLGYSDYAYAWASATTHNVNISAPVGGTLVFRSSCKVTKLYVNGVEKWDNGSAGSGLSLFVLEDVLAGDDINIVTYYTTYLARPLSVNVEPIGARKVGDVRTPPHPRIETGDRRWLDHWVSVHKSLSLASNIASSVTGIQHSQSYRGDTIVSGAEETLATITVEETGTHVIYVLACFDIMASYGALTVKTKLNGSAVDTKSAALTYMGTQNFISDWAYVYQAEAIYNAGDVIALTRTMPPGYESYSGYVELWRY
jgi:hypothetical protein